jgi:hypothetical protein
LRIKCLILTVLVVASISGLLFTELVKGRRVLIRQLANKHAEQADSYDAIASDIDHDV